MADIWGSIARSFGSSSRVWQLSMIAGAMPDVSISESDCVAKTTEAFFFRSVFNHFAELAGKAFIVQREPPFVDDQERRPAVEAIFDPMKEIGEYGGCGYRPDQSLGLEHLHRGLPKPLGLGVEQTT